jgi:hypothetical protein
MTETIWFWILMVFLAVILPVGTVVVFKLIARLIPIPEKCLSYRNHFDQLKKNTRNGICWADFWGLPVSVLEDGLVG